MRSVPARPNASTRSLGLDITLGPRSAHFEGGFDSNRGGYTLAVYVGGHDVARVNTQTLSGFGVAATSPSGSTLSQPLRDWLDAVGQLLLRLPAAAELSDAASNLLLAIP